MLDGLGTVDWKTLKHAYGPATDVPDMIRALGSADAGIRDSAMHSAFGNIFHQGTRYPATPAALPFLVELAAQPHHEDVGGLLGLIVRCTAGYFTPTRGPCTASGAAWGEVAPPMSNYGETIELLERIEVAAEPAVPLCAKLLGHSDPGVRQRAAWLLAALRRFADRYEIRPR